jgi:hypothetical protein
VQKAESRDIQNEENVVILNQKALVFRPSAFSFYQDEKTNRAVHPNSTVDGVKPKGALKRQPVTGN